MGGHDRLPYWLEYVFEQRVQESFKNAKKLDKHLLRMERYAMLDDVADEILCALRFGVLDNLPEASHVVRVAEIEALETFNRRVTMEYNILRARSPPLVNQ